MTVTPSELKNIVEAALLIAGQPLTIDKLVTLFPEDSRPTRDQVRAVLKQLQEEGAGHGVELKQIEHAWRYQTRPQYADWVTRSVLPIVLAFSAASTRPRRRPRRCPTT